MVYIQSSKETLDAELTQIIVCDQHNLLKKQSMTRCSYKTPTSLLPYWKEMKSFVKHSFP